MASQAELLERVSALLGRRDLSQVEFANWIAGTADGGPNGDGRYPLSDSTGFIRMLPSPAKVVELSPLPRTVTPADVPAGGAFQSVDGDVLTVIGAVPIMLPATGGRVVVRDPGRTWAAASPTIIGNGRTINGDPTFLANVAGYEFAFDSQASGVSWAVSFIEIVAGA